MHSTSIFNGKSVSDVYRPMLRTTVITFNETLESVILLTDDAYTHTDRQIQQHIYTDTHTDEDAVRTRVSTLFDKKFQDFSRTFRDRQNIFPGPYWIPPTFKYEDKQQLLLYIQSVIQCVWNDKYFEIYNYSSPEVCKSL